MVGFNPIIPRGNAIYSYYGIPNPRLKKEPQLLEINKDPYLSYFTFNDISRILPYSDQACPGDGICAESTQTLIKMHMNQDTDMTKKYKNYFLLNLPANATASERETAKELVMKNETNLKGDVYLEGSIKQLRNLLKN